MGSLQRARWLNDPATLPALGQDKYDASVRASRVMVVGQKIFMPVGCAETKPRRRSRSAMVFKCGGSLCAGQRTGGGQDATVNSFFWAVVMGGKESMVACWGADEP